MQMFPAWFLPWALLAFTLPTLLPSLIGVVCSWCMARTSETFGVVVGLIAAAGWIPFAIWAVWFVGFVQDRVLQADEAYAALIVLLVVQVSVVLGTCWYANRK